MYPAKIFPGKRVVNESKIIHLRTKPVTKKTMSYEELKKVVEHYRLLAAQSHLISEQKAFLYRNFADVVETNIELLEDASSEDDLWTFYNEHTADGYAMLNPDEEAF